MEILRRYLKAERGRTSRLAEALDLFPGAITQWKAVPAKHALLIERLTGISRHDLCPDIYGPAPKAKRKQAA